LEELSLFCSTSRLVIVHINVSLSKCHEIPTNHITFRCVLQDITECNSERPMLQEQDNVRLKKYWISEGKKEKGKKSPARQGG